MYFNSNSFGIDIMHLVLEGVAKHLLQSWMGKMTFDDRSEEHVNQSYIISLTGWAEIGRTIAGGRKMIPSVFRRSPRDISKHSAGFKAVE